jgi:hypothetical protein
MMGSPRGLGVQDYQVARSCPNCCYAIAAIHARDRGSKFEFSEGYFTSGQLHAPSFVPTDYNIWMAEAQSRLIGLYRPFPPPNNSQRCFICGIRSYFMVYQLIVQTIYLSRILELHKSTQGVKFFNSLVLWRLRTSSILLQDCCATIYDTGTSVS